MAKTTKNEVAEHDRYGDRIVIPSLGSASGLLPELYSDSASHQFGSNIFSGLVKYDENLLETGDLAHRWDIADEGKTITFHLRQGVTFHDGAPFRARDVLFTFNAIINPDFPSPYKRDFEQVDTVEIIDEYTVQVRYKNVYARALIGWSKSILPRHILEGVDIPTSDFMRHPIGTGPYRFVEWQKGQFLRLAAFENYYEKKPYITELIYKVIPDTTTQFMELRNRSIDMMDLTPVQFSRQTENDTFRKDYVKYRYPSSGYTYLGYNLRNPLFQDKRVRQALSYAINQQELIDGVLMGLGVAATGPYRPDSWAYNPDVRRYTYDPAQALALFAEVGYQLVNGVLQKDGVPFRFEIITNQGNDSRRKSAEIIQRRLQEIGITVTIRVIEWASFINEFINKGKFDATILGWNILPDPDIYSVWHSPGDNQHSLNFTAYANPRVDELLELGRSTLDQEKRKHYYGEIQQILAEEQPYTFLYIPQALPAVSRRFENIYETPAGITHNFIHWYARPENRMIP
ncbi:peptide-binding protein [Chrysiogenes arsenatis]|uniref:peptide-binding protein n=1 Tax=Chrysiogenes arsenatis TaxID=309797 RepID=UPI00040F2C2C|nr:peptide-binding protein [Chrysiogenes arsenatis]